MVLGGQPPGRVGRRRFLSSLERPPSGGPFGVDRRAELRLYRGSSAISQWWPKGSITRPCRSPYGWSSTGKRSVAPAATARAGLQSVPGGTVVHLWVRDLPPDPAAVYEVRCEAPGWSASAGTFRVDARGRAYVVLTTAARRGEYDVIKIVSRRRGTDGRVRTAAVLDGRLS